jgi:hypothetical protein
MKLAVVTATTNLPRALPCLQSWRLPPEVSLIVVLNGGAQSEAEKQLDATYLASTDYLGTVPAFNAGVTFALEHTDADVIAAIHDDLEIQQAGWTEEVLRLFSRRLACGLAGFGGAIGLGQDDIYQTPYNPMQLARIGFRSNLVDAEVHGLRSLLSERVACLDGFSQIGRREFFEGFHATTREHRHPPPWEYLDEHGIVHHCYDSLLGCLAKRLGWEAWYLPLRCRHYGGQTAVADQGYQQWAKTQIPDGDQGYWQQSHKRGYELFRDVLPIRV